MGPLRYAAKFDPFLSLDCALHPGAIQGKEGIKFCHLATLVEGVREQGDADTHARPRRRRQDDHTLQAEAGAVGQHDPHGGVQRGDRHLQERQVQRLGM